MSDNDPQPSPGQENVNAAGVAQTVGNGAMGNGQPGAQNIQGMKRPRTTGDDDDDDDDGKPNRERRKIEIKFIQDKSRRHITFSKRKAGIMKKAYELSVLTGTQVLLLVVSETGLVYTFTTPKLQPLVTKAEGKNLIQACLNAPEPGPHSTEGGADVEPPESPEEPAHPPLPQQPGRPGPPIQQQPQSYMTAEQHAAYQQYLAQVQQQQRPHMPYGQQPSHPSHAS